MKKKPFAGFSVPCRIGLLVCSLIVIIIDQASKAIVRHHLALYQPVPFWKGHWNWMLSYNKGAAFGFLSTQSGWQGILFGLVAALVAVFLVYYILNRAYGTLAGFGLSFILGGAIGNLIDRFMFGEVTDFIDWHAGVHHFATFNIADAFINVGIALLIIETIFFSKKHEPL